jgi:hypothetical protein
MRHVDFEASWDGPVVDGGLATGEGLARGPLTSIDELVICEECLTVAGALLGLEPQDQTRIDALECQLDDARSANLELQAHVKEQDRALASRTSFSEKQQQKRKQKAAA